MARGAERKQRNTVDGPDRRARIRPESGTAPQTPRASHAAQDHAPHPRLFLRRRAGDRADRDHLLPRLADHQLDRQQDHALDSRSLQPGDLSAVRRPGAGADHRLRPAHADRLDGGGRGGADLDQDHRASARPHAGHPQRLQRHQADLRDRAPPAIDRVPPGGAVRVSEARELGARLHHRQDAGRGAEPDGRRGGQRVPADHAQPDIGLSPVHSEKGAGRPQHDRRGRHQDGGPPAGSSRPRITGATRSGRSSGSRPPRATGRPSPTTRARGRRRSRICGSANHPDRAVRTTASRSNR